MPSYSEWNKAVLEFVTQGIPLGSRVFLSIDEISLIQMGSFLDDAPPPDQRIENFLKAVRDKCVIENAVDLSQIEPKHDETDVPPYLGFLAATVLAAYRMAEDEDTSQNNYFTRLNEVLGFREGMRGRPRGLEIGREESFWLDWANWLTRLGFLPSTPKEMTGPLRYISYPISQTLLRASDKVSLLNHFTERRWLQNLDDSSVSMTVLKEKQLFTSHIRSLLSDDGPDASRREGLLDAIYELYDFWASNNLPASDIREFAYLGPRNIMAGLYRQLDIYANQPRYFVLPKQPQRTKLNNSRVVYGEDEYPLVQDRPGWYQPLWLLSSQELTNGVRAEVVDALEIQQLILPARDFWILGPDPDDPSSGLYGSWSRPGLGTPFILICKSHLEDQLNSLRRQELIDWGEELPTKIWQDNEWLEFRDVLVRSQDWHGAFIQNQELLRSLQPKSSLGVSLRGGLRAPGGGGWLTGYGPELTVHSFYPEATVEVFEPISNHAVTNSDVVKTNKSTRIGWPTDPGNYLIVVRSGRNMNEETSVPFNVIDWSSLIPATLSPEAQITLGSSKIAGAFIDLEQESE